MINLEKYKMSPVRTLFSKKIKYAEGIPEDTLKLATEFGILTKQEFEVAKGIKNKGNVSLSETQASLALKELLEKHIIIEQ